MSKYPILFEENETEFKTHGIGVLSDAVQCDVTEELNGIFELNMVYPSNGTYLKELKNSRIIYADASRELGCQPFRICRITKLLNGLINVYAQHISYDLGGIQLPPFETVGTTDGMKKIKTYSTTSNPYSFTTTAISNDSFSIDTPKSVRSYLLGAKDSFLQTYGGEFTFDRFNVRHSTLRGSDKGFRVKYGVNLVDLNQEESIERTYTGIYPYYKDEYMFMDLNESYDLMYPHEVDTSKLFGKIMNADGDFYHTKIANVDLSAYFEIAPLSTDELKEVAKQYMKDNEIGIPAVSLDVRFESLRNSPEYSNVIFLEDVFLGDTIHVDFVKLGVSATGRINTIIYDSLRHKNKRVSVGDPKNNVSDTLVSITNSVKGSETSILGISRSVAKIDILTNQNAAGITALTSRVTETEKNFGHLEILVDGHRSELEAIAKWQDETDESIASIESEASENAAKISLLVETSENGEDSVRGELLVEAINGQSTATINADKVNLTGYVTINSLKAGGRTVIDGSRIQTGQIISSNFAEEYMLIKENLYEPLIAGTYYFRLDSEHDYEFTTTKDIPIGGSLKFYKEEKKIETLYSSGTVIETLTVTEGTSYGDMIEPDNSFYFSESGTKFDLESGEIISSQFAILSDGSSYFGGKLNTSYGRVGPFLLAPAGLYTQYPTPAFDSGGYVGLFAGGIDFSSDRYYENEEGWIRLKIGDSLSPNYGGNPHKVELSNKNGQKFLLNLKDAQLIGAWKATPYKNPTKAISEIVTKQDLIDLGLITA